jgi:sigma-B regulation protein RsbU (phosphoserine phosphatase)
MDREELLSEILRVAREMIRAEGSSILLADDETGDLIFTNTSSGEDDYLIGQRVPRGKGIAGKVASSGKAEIVNDVRNNPHFFSEIDQRSSFTTRNILCLPMTVFDRLVGVLEVVNTIDRDSFSELDFLTAQYIAEQAAIALSSRQLIDDLNARVLELETLYNISQSIALAGTYDFILSWILRALADSLKVRRALIVMKHGSGNDLKVEATLNIDTMTDERQLLNCRGILMNILQSGDPFISTDKRKQTLLDCQEETALKSSSFIAVPVINKGVPIGVMCIMEKINGDPFTSFDLRLVTTVGSQVAESYQNMINQKRIEAQKMLDREIDIAARIQKRTLPSIPEEVQGHSLKAWYSPARIVGGDFYDFFQDDDGSYAVLIADISGKGIPAAVFMGSARNLIRSERPMMKNPAAFIQKINSKIFEDSESGMFITLFYAYVDVNEEKMTCVSAGHNPQLLLNTRTGAWQSLKGKGRALGLLPDTEYEEQTIPYEKDDMLVLFTDGVVESLGGEELDIRQGEERLIKILLQSPDNLDDIIQNLDVLRIKSPLDDDLKDDFTLLLVRFH